MVPNHSSSTRRIFNTLSKKQYEAIAEILADAKEEVTVNNKLDSTLVIDDLITTFVDYFQWENPAFI